MMHKELIRNLQICKEGEHCDRCDFYELKMVNGLCACTGELCNQAANAIKELSKRVPSVPHGDLIDRNEIFAEFVIEGQKSMRYKVGEKWELNGEEIRRVIQRLPAVIPTEEDE